MRPRFGLRSAHFDEGGSRHVRDNTHRRPRPRCVRRRLELERRDRRLQAKGVPVTAPANPLRGIAADSAYIAAVIEQIEGPVVAVGHSYAGAVITNAAVEARNVVGLVFVAAFAPEEGEPLGEADGGVEGRRPGQAFGPTEVPRRRGRRPRSSHRSAGSATPSQPTCPPSSRGDGGHPAARLRARRSPSRRGRRRGRTGRHGRSSRPATGRRAPTSTRSMAERAGATITEVDGSHVIMVSQPRSRDQRDPGSRGGGRSRRPVGA